VISPSLSLIRRSLGVNHSISGTRFKYVLADFLTWVAIWSEAEQAELLEERRGTNKMKSWKLLACLFATLLCGSLPAQNVINANIPFNFELGRATLPPGEYRIEQVNHILRWHCVKAHTGAFIMMVPTSGGERRTTGMLHFNRYGDTYFFAGVDMPYNGSG